MSGAAAKRSGWVYAFAHLATETACFFWLYRYLTTNAVWSLAYDVLVFVPQLFFGLYADRHPERKMGPAGLAILCAVMAVSPCLSRVDGSGLWRIPVFLVMTVGNCLVHVAGAEATARDSGGKMGPAGIFVGAGSFGLIAGRLLGAAQREVLLLIPASLLAASFLLALRDYDPVRMAKPAAGFRVSAERGLGTIVTLAFLTVAVRAYIGYAIPTGWVENNVQLVILYVFMGVGKMLGGVLADRFGARRVSVLSLALALPLLIVGSRNMIVSLLGVLLFSMTMAISFGILLSHFPGQPGFAFGVTTFALSVGTMPAFFIRLPGLVWSCVVITVLTAAAIACFALSTSNHIIKESSSC